LTATPLDDRGDPGDGAPAIRIGGIIDRFDRHADGSIEVIDCKTGTLQTASAAGATTAGSARAAGEKAERTAAGRAAMLTRPPSPDKTLGIRK